MTLNNTPHSVGLFWNRDQPVAEGSIWQNKTLSSDRKTVLAGFEPVVPVTDLPQNHVLDNIAFEIG